MPPSKKLIQKPKDFQIEMAGQVLGILINLIGHGSCLHKFPLVVDQVPHGKFSLLINAIFDVSFYSSLDPLSLKHCQESHGTSYTVNATSQFKQNAYYRLLVQGRR